MKEIVTRKIIADRIRDLLEKNVSISDFGEEMFRYLAFDDEFEFESGYEPKIKKVLDEFSEMHDVGKKNPGYEPEVPSQERLKEILNDLERE